MADGEKNRTRKFFEVTPPPAEVLPPLRDGQKLPPLRDKKGFGTDLSVDLHLGPLEPLLGVWTAVGTGWNMIALPFADAPPSPHGFNFRVLMNQYDEELTFTFVDSGVPNRGLLRAPNPTSDQLVVTVDYQQKISQVAAEDRPASKVAGGPGLAIHHEPGLWLHMRNLRSDDVEGTIDVARLASIPHGNSVLAIGHSAEHEGMPKIPPLSGLPTGQFENVVSPGYDFRGDDPYLEPYDHYVQKPYMGNVNLFGFPGFSPADMNEILRFANEGVDIKRTTTLTVDTTRRDASIVSAPFTTREAEPVSMKSTFWIQELSGADIFGRPRFRLQYSQVVMLEFFRPREDEHPGRMVWPHISIATLEKVPANYGAIRAEPTRRRVEPIPKR